MAPNPQNALPKWLRFHDVLNSTNNYAMQLIDDGMAQHGDVTWAHHQTSGKGQRGRVWQDEPGRSLMMSLVLVPRMEASEQFSLSAAIAYTIASYLKTIFPNGNIAIKWPNDIYINDKKACGILIENVFRGMDWHFAVVGIGINVNQQHFPADMPLATSLLIESGVEYHLQEIIQDLRAGILNTLQALPEDLLSLYNHLLFKRGEWVRFYDEQKEAEFDGKVMKVTAQGELQLETEQGLQHFRFGSLAWRL